MSYFLSYFLSFFQKNKTKEYFQSLDTHDLVSFIQPLWNTYNMGLGEKNMSKTQLNDLNLALTEYKDRGLDTAYFTNGSGAPGNCIIS